MAKIDNNNQEEWKVIWTDPAVNDLSDIAEYIAQDSEHYASAIAKGLYEAAESLSLFPLRGRVVPEFDRENFRELIYRPYRIVYKVEVERVAILAIIHSSRDLRKAVSPKLWDVS